MDATPASTGLNIIINVVLVREAARERIVTLETPAITIDLHASSRFYVYLTTRRSSLSSVRSNASRQNVFYCVHAQETFIINPDHGSLPHPPGDPAACLFFNLLSPMVLPPCLSAAAIERVEIVGKIASRFAEDLPFSRAQRYGELSA